MRALDAMLPKLRHRATLVQAPKKSAMIGLRSRAVRSLQGPIESGTQIPLLGKGGVRVWLGQHPRRIVLEVDRTTPFPSFCQGVFRAVLLASAITVRNFGSSSQVWVEARARSVFIGKGHFLWGPSHSVGLTAAINADSRGAVNCQEGELENSNREVK